MTACPKCSNAFTYKYYENDVYRCKNCGFLGTEMGYPIILKDQEKKITKEMITTKLMIWMMREKKEARHLRTFPAWEIRDAIQDMGGPKSWWNREMRIAIANELETTHDDLYLGWLGPQVGYVLTSDKTIAAGLIPWFLNIMEGFAESVNLEVLSAEDQARLNGVVKALVESGKSIEDLTDSPSAELPSSTVQKLEERIRLLGEPAMSD